jgi:hypothetical protein
MASNISQTAIQLKDITSRDPREHTAQLGRALKELSDHLRRDVEKVDDPKAQALFETSAEVLDGLQKAYRDFEARREGAWK